jgi:hypothetical protein
MLFSKTDDSCVQFLLTKKEFEKIKHSFQWTIGPEDFVINSEDYFTGKQLKVFEELFQEICNDFNIKKYTVSFYSGIYYFDIKKQIDQKFYPIEKGPVRCYHDQTVPEKGRPRFEYGEDYILEWYHEYGLYKKQHKIYKDEAWFVHPITDIFMFYNEADYENFIKKFQKNMYVAKRIKSDDQLFIRVINVYDKITKELKYRVINTEFIASGLDNFIEPFEGDELLFFRSYLVTEEIADYIIKMFSNGKIDFDFKKNEYFLETLSAEDFIYSYNDFVKDLELKS